MIQGKTMIQRVYEQAIQADVFNRVIVATDDMRILEHVESFGGNVMMTSGKHASGTDRCGEVIQTLAEEYDIAVNIQGDEPFIQPAQLKSIVGLFKHDKTQIATLAIEIKNIPDVNNPNAVKVVFDKDNKALYFSRSAIPFNRTDSTDTKYYKHIGVYAYRTEILEHIIRLPQSSLELAESLEQLRWLQNGFSIHVAETEIETIGIDTPEDLMNLPQIH